MRTLGIVILSALLALAPALQIGSCLCAKSGEGGTRTAQMPECCCAAESGGATTCRCAGCAHNSGGHTPHRSDALAGCGCAKVQPQTLPLSDSEVALALPLMFEYHSHGMDARPSDRPATAPCHGAAPPCFRPLLL